ncbi:MAG: methyltransferase domain-containing protein [Gammaproteobacteria bacterium]|nr:methyltransferase domain-containing protein [Gammaproteobacteria bacterium]
MSVELLRTNYSELGSKLIEQMYSDDYLSIGGAASTTALAAEAGISKSTAVLDVGSGLGGPALQLAATFGCTVTGLDLVESNTTESIRRAAQRGLEKLVRFEVGDATQMPFEGSQFDVVWGQDAWCHVPDKDKLIGESARVLRRSGVIAFTDWIKVGAMDEAFERDVMSATVSTAMETAPGYCQLLEKHGFEVTQCEDISHTFISQYEGVMERVKGLEASISSTYSPKVYAIIFEKNELIARAFKEKKIGGTKIIGVQR